MKTSSITLILLLLLAGAFPAFAQYDFGTDEGVTCWQCPVCGAVLQLTPSEVATVLAYPYYYVCPICGNAYEVNFVQVPCQTATGFEETDGTANNSAIPSSRSVPVVPVPSTGSESSSASVKGKILMVLPPQQYQEEELNVPRDYFQSQGYSVVLACKGVKTATGMSGEAVSIDLDLKAVNLSEYAAVVFVGGEGIYYQKLNEDPDYQALAKAVVAQHRLIGAICLGPWILADAGLLQGKRATASETEHIKAKGAIVSDEAVVRDGNIITGNGPSASLEFAQAIVAALKESGSSAEQGVSGKEAGLALTAPLGPSSQAISTESAPKWKCTVCGYIYDPTEHGNVPFEQLPSTWKCPCGAPKSKFVKI